MTVSCLYTCYLRIFCAIRIGSAAFTYAPCRSHVHILKVIFFLKLKGAARETARFLLAGSVWRNAKDGVDSLHSVFTNKLVNMLFDYANEILLIITKKLRIKFRTGITTLFI